VDAPEKTYLPLKLPKDISKANSERCPFRLPTGWAFLFPLLVSQHFVDFNKTSPIPNGGDALHSFLRFVSSHT
jgi:hypothetical protein